MKRNHTIGFDAGSTYANLTGPGNQGRYLIDALATACPRNAFLRVYTPQRLKNTEYDILSKLDNVEPMEPDGSFWRRHTKLWRAFGVARDAHRGSVELFHGLDTFLPYGLGKYDIRSVITIRDLIVLRYPSTMNILKRIYTRFKLRSACRRADRIIAISECTKRDLVNLMKIDPEKIDVIYPGFDPRYAQEISAEAVEAVKQKYGLPDRYILNVGTQHARKNIELIISAMDKLSVEIDLVVAGRNTSHTSRLKRTAKRLSLGDRVHFLDSVTKDELAAIYRGALMLIYPTHYSSFGMPIIEAMSVGIPVIGATGSSHEEAGGNAAIYVSPNDSDALAEHIEELLDNEQLRLEMVRRGHDYVTRFRPEVTAYNILNCYRRIGIDLIDRR